MLSLEAVLYDEKIREKHEQRALFRFTPTTRSSPHGGVVVLLSLRIGIGSLSLSIVSDLTAESQVALWYLPTYASAIACCADALFPCARRVRDKGLVCKIIDLCTKTSPSISALSRTQGLVGECEWYTITVCTTGIVELSNGFVPP